MKVEHRQVATNGIEVWMDDNLYLASKHGSLVKVYTWSNNDWNFDLPISDIHLNEIARCVSASNI